MRQRLTQDLLSARAGVSRQAVSHLECGRARLLKMGVVEAILAALGARIDARVLWNGPELDRLVDAGHASLGARIKRRLERWGWVVRVEVSYSRYGERGRIDLLAWHPVLRVVLVVEIKTSLVDVQALLGSLDVKTRLARHIAEPLGWEVHSVVPAIAFADDRTTRRRLEQLDTLFDRFSLRGRACVTWLRRPEATPSGLLWFVALTEPGRARNSASSRRVRTARPAS